MKNALLLIHQGFTDIIVCFGMMFYYSNHYNLTVIVRDDMKAFLELIFKNININFLFYPINIAHPDKVESLVDKLLKEKIINVDEILRHGVGVSRGFMNGNEFICNANFFIMFLQEIHLIKLLLINILILKETLF
jgi:hypothetical protein